jgi:hypothetical protein
MVKAAELSEIPRHQCFAHALKGVIEAVCGEKPLAKSYDLHQEMVALHLLTIKTVAKVLRTTSWLHEELHGSDENALELIIENVTRWEGKWAAIERFLSMKNHLRKCVALKDYFAKVNTKVVADDLFSETFFSRLRGYKDLFDVFHKISKMSQSENQCSIAWVPSWIYKIKSACKSSNSLLGSKLAAAVDDRLIPMYLKGSTPVLKAALLNPCTSEYLTRKL